MNDITYRSPRPHDKLARTLLALFTAAMLVGSAVTGAKAAVTLVRFEAKWQTDGSILVVWETSSELDSSDFFLYRAESQNGPWDDYVDWEPALGDGFTGATYSFVDEEVSPNGTYYYYLEEVASDSSSNYFGPIVPTRSSTNPATNTPTATKQPNQGSQPTATRQYTNTPSPSATGPIVPTQTQRPAQSQAPLQATPTRSSLALVTTPTPVGGAAPTIEAMPPTPAVTATPESEQIQPTASPTATETPTQQVMQETLTPSPTAQRLAAALKETSQPLLDASAIQITPEPSTGAPQNTTPNSRLALLLGGGALLAAAILGALALLIWRWRAR
jgi:hypothetical protein